MLKTLLKKYLVSDMKNILIVGKTGLVSKNISKHLKYNLGFLSREDGFALEKIDEFNFENIDKYDIIIFTSAISSPDICTDNESYARIINVDSTKIFIQKALLMDKKVIFLSSDAVYGADNGYPFCENDFPIPFSNYGKMKLEIEQTFKSYANFKSLRLSYVLNKEDKYTSYCTQCIKDGKKAEIFHPLYRNVITTLELSRMLEYIIDNFENINMPFINAAGPHLASRVQIFDEICRYIKIDGHNIIVKPKDEFYKIRPAITEMISNLKLDIFRDTFSLRISEMMEEK